MSNEIAPGTECQWYLLCTNEATLLEPHPILKQVPICQRCKDKVDKIAAM